MRGTASTRFGKAAAAWAGERLGVAQAARVSPHEASIQKRR